jgi:hypothetical protein
VAELERYATDSDLLDKASTGSLAFANGLENYRAQLAWTRRARKRLTEKRT